ncbi:hypothetical protein BN6_54600 [Saccharothrix espanaensis DSM 44229]|uniref:Uncharacterized protein n=1 Tax=Saccharothrix espanaensis (strain ATCC 51144 / DSM 44229 / JCM 9112 / NBRC 15066 / NRRL 15764) TaxID=1179773 RepID=K0K746_SACES|nr:hypothetical protein BN6_54600 [Saccharothrix espanaensis DSM 44229]
MRGNAARHRRGALPCLHPAGRPRVVTSSRPRRRIEPAVRTTGARAAIPRGAWWTARGDHGLLGSDTEVGGDDRVELRSHPCRLGADQVGEVALVGLGQPPALCSREAGNARAVHLDHSHGSEDDLATVYDHIAGLRGRLGTDLTNDAERRSPAATRSGDRSAPASFAVATVESRLVPGPLREPTGDVGARCGIGLGSGVLVCVGVSAGEHGTEPGGDGVGGGQHIAVQ